MILSSIAIFSCMKEDKSTVLDPQKNLKTELRDFIDCGPDLQQTNCISYPYSNISVPTFMGCNAIASYSVLVCKTNSSPFKVTSIAVYNLDVQYDFANCTTLLDSIEYYVIIGNQTRASYLINMFNRLATQNIEALVVNNELGTNQALYLCGEGSMVNLDFFASKCYKFCPIGKKQVVCGLGCCKRSTGYCYKDGEIQKSFPAISQSAPCESKAGDPCESGSYCSASACEALVAVALDPK